MKLLTYLFTLLFVFNAMAVAPYGIKGQTQTGTLYSNVHQFPNNLVTNLGGIDALVETGNTNILSNPSFEHATFSTGWTNVAGVFAVESTVVVHGKKSAKVTLSSQALDLSQDSTLYQAQFADGVQGLASVRIKTTVTGLRVCSRQNGVVTSNLCVDIQANGKWGLYKVPFILGGTSNGIEIDSNGATVTGDVYVDDAFVGAVDLSADVVTSSIYGKVTYGSNCFWTRNGSTYSDFTADASCTITASGNALSPSTNIPAIKLSSMPAGKYVFIYSGHVGCGLDGGGDCRGTVRLTNGTLIADETPSIETTQSAVTAGDEQTSAALVFTLDVNSSLGETQFNIQGSNTLGTSQLLNYSGSGTTSGSMTVFYYPLNSSVYSSTNADTDWQSCGHTTADFTGFGTVSAIETQCKRQGSDLLIRGRFTVGAATGVEARVDLPVWNGLQLVSASSSKISSIEKAGEYFRDTSSVAHGGAILIEPSVSYFAFGHPGTFGDSLIDAISKDVGNSIAAVSFPLVINARIPIAGWENSNIIIGQFNGLESCTDSYECESLFTAQISSTGVVTAENIDWINGNCSMTLGAASCTLKTGLAGSGSNLISGMNCGVTGVAATRIPIIASSGSSTVVFELANTAGASTAGNMSVYCQKQGADYIGKTAKAVASDQNLSTPGVTKGVVFSAAISTSGVVSNQFGNLISGNCTNAATSVCTFDTSKYSGTLNCQVNNASSTAVWCNHLLGSGNISIYCWNGNGTSFTTSVAKSITCHGVKP